MRSANLLGLHLLNIAPIIVALDLGNHLIRILSLLIPSGRQVLQLLAEQLIVGLAVAAAQTVPQGRELAVVEVEVEVVHGVAGGAVDDGVLGVVLAVVDHDGPDVDEHEEGDVGELLEREDEGEEVVGEALGVAVERVERVGCVGRGHDPLVVRLVQVLVDARVVQPAVDPVDAEVGEAEEERELQDVVPPAGALVHRVVDLGVAADFDEEPGSGQGGHDGEGDVRLAHLEADLVLEVSGVVEGGLVEDEDVG